MIIQTYLITTSQFQGIILLYQATCSLENSTDKNENSNLNNASTYDATGEVCAVQDFDRMEVEGSPCSIFELVAQTGPTCITI